MKRTDEFASDMIKALAPHTSKLGLRWRRGGPLKARRESCDVTGVSDTLKKQILIEVELRRDAPLTNVVKVWKWIEQEKVLPRKEVVLIQAFSSNYTRKDTRRDNAQFVGKQMQNQCGVLYIPLSFRYRPRKYGLVGAGRRRLHAVELAKRILRTLRREGILPRRA